MTLYTRIASYWICTGARSHVIHTPSGRGDALQAMLRSKGIDSEVSCLAGTAYDQVEVGRHINAQALQTLLKYAAALSGGIRLAAYADTVHPTYPRPRRTSC
jgi:hypothetical protein